MTGRDLYIVYAGGTATAADAWDRGTVCQDVKARWDRVASHVNRERAQAITEVISRRETKTHR